MNGPASNISVTRRDFLESILAAGTAGTLTNRGLAAPSPTAFRFILLGDLHYDKIEHHDSDWLKREKPDDVRQVENYSRITREITPRLFTTVRDVISDQNKSGQTPIAFVLQVGDLVEGLCGTGEMAVRQNRDAVAFVRKAGLGVPFLFTKGNHDVTGPGATEAFREVFHPFLTAETRRLSPDAPKLASARFAIEHGGAQFVFFDAYDAESLAWLEAVAAKRSARHFFVVVHPPVVPYGARATWHLFSSAKDRARREKLLDVLAQQEAIVLGGHIHKFNALARTVGRRRFAQLAISSIINSPAVAPKDVLSGVAEYNGDQIRVEPRHSPGTEKERRAIYDAERRFVTAFDYADLPGYASVTVDGPRVEAQIFPGIGRTPWRTVALDRLPA